MSEEIQFAGVKNTSGEAVTGRHGGIPYSFEKDEIKVLAAHQVQFLLQRNILSTDGRLVTRKYLFQEVPLAQALKFAKEPENKSVAEAKKALDAREKQKAELKEEILEELRSKGLHAAADRVSGKK